MHDLLVREPFVGPQPFQRDDAWRFFGRADVADELLSLLLASRTLLLYSQSGAGKTSLVNAGLLPLAEEEDFDILPPARVQGVLPEGVSTGSIGSPYTFFTLASWKEIGVGGNQPAGSITEALRLRPRTLDRFGDPAPRLIVLDQFEELFTTYPDHWEDRARYFEDLACALTEDPQLHVLFCLREDHLADMLSLAKLLPDQARTRFRLSRLRYHDAVEAIQAPIIAAGRSFAPGVVDSLVQDLLRIRVETTPGQAADVQGEFVEPVQLQVVCSSLWRSLPPETTEITDAHVRSFGDVSTALARYYEDAVIQTVWTTGAPEWTVRHWFGTQLITPANTRSMAYRGPHWTAGLDNRSIDVLENLHMIRAELRAGARWYELTHDRFIGPIQWSNAMAYQVQLEASRRPRSLRPRPWGIVPLVLAAVLSLLLFQIRNSDRAPLEACGRLAIGGLVGLAIGQLLTIPSEAFLWRAAWHRRCRWIIGLSAIMFGLFVFSGVAHFLTTSPEESAIETFATYVEDPRLEGRLEPDCGGSSWGVFVNRPEPLWPSEDIRKTFARDGRRWCASEASGNLNLASVCLGTALTAMAYAACLLWRWRHDPHRSHRR